VPSWSGVLDLLCFIPKWAWYDVCVCVSRIISLSIWLMIQTGDALLLKYCFYLSAGKQKTFKHDLHPTIHPYFTLPFHGLIIQENQPEMHSHHSILLHLCTHNPKPVPSTTSPRSTQSSTHIGFIFLPQVHHSSQNSLTLCHPSFQTKHTTPFSISTIQTHFNTITHNLQTLIPPIITTFPLHSTRTPNQQHRNNPSPSSSSTGTKITKTENPRSPSPNPLHSHNHIISFHWALHYLHQSRVTQSFIPIHSNQKQKAVRKRQNHRRRVGVSNRDGLGRDNHEIWY